MFDEVVITHLQAVHVRVECMIPWKVFLIIEEYFIASCENPNLRKDLSCMIVQDV